MSTSRAEDLGPGPAEAWSLRLSDRPGALERVLGVLRRRLVRLEALSLKRAAGDELAVELRLAMAPEQKDRIRAELRSLVDVHPPGPQVAVEGNDLEPDGPTGP